MAAVLSYLKQLNRKERFHLLTEALGPFTFTLDRHFRERLQDCLGCRLPKAGIPQDAFVAMDYHMDWIQIALHLAEKLPCFPNDGKKEEHICHSKDELGQYLLRGNQQDIDLLVAFDDDKKTHIILIEAKAETGWTNEQLNGGNGKIERLKVIFGENGEKSNLSVPHLILSSPRYSKGVKVCGWPRWAKNEATDRSYYWLRLPLPELIQVTRTKKAESGDGYKRLRIKRKHAIL